jgi:pimeloyl-ACP methyl ester carboxylesterase
MKSVLRHLTSPSAFFAQRVWYHPMALTRRLINYYLLVFVALFLMQNSLLYPRWMAGAVLTTQEGTEKAAANGLDPWNHPTAGAASPQGFVSPDFSKPAPRGTVVVFHGNGVCAFDRGIYQDAFAARGFRTFLYEYPGYGGRPGSPCAASIVGDAQNLIRSLDQMGYGPVYVWGESIGSGVACAVCQDQTLPVHGLTLMMPWDSLSHVAAVHYPIMPVTHLTGSRKLIVKDGYGHGDWPCSPELAWWDAALDFIAPQQKLAHSR